MVDLVVNADEECQAAKALAVFVVPMGVFSCRLDGHGCLREVLTGESKMSGDHLEICALI